MGPPPPSAPPAIPPKTAPARIPAKILPKPRPPIEAEISEGGVTVPSPLKESKTAYSRAAQLSARVGTRMDSVDALTKAHQPAPFVRGHLRSGSAAIKRWTQSRENLREAFIASLVFAPPAGLRSPAQESTSDPVSFRR